MNQNSMVALSIILIVVVVAAIIFGGVLIGAFPSGSTTTTQISQTGCPSSGCIRKLPIRFVFMNLYTPNLITDSITATIYRGTTQVDSSTFSGGIWDTTKADFQSVDSYSLYAMSGNSKYEFNFQVPLAQNLTQARFQITLNMALIGSYTITVLAPDGVTPITSGYNATSGVCNGVTSCKATKQPTFTVTLINGPDDTGLTASFARNEIPENGGVRQLVANALVITMSGQNGAPAKIHTTTPIITLPDHATNKHRLQDGSLASDAKGTYTAQITLDTSSMTQGASDQITLVYYAYLDIAYFNANNTANSEAVALATTQFVVSV